MARPADVQRVRRYQQRAGVGRAICRTTGRRPVADQSALTPAASGQPRQPSRRWSACSGRTPWPVLPGDARHVPGPRSVAEIPVHGARSTVFRHEPCLLRDRMDCVHESGSSPLRLRRPCAVCLRGGGSGRQNHPCGKDAARVREGHVYSVVSGQATAKKPAGPSVNGVIWFKRCMSLEGRSPWCIRRRG